MRNSEKIFYILISMLLISAMLLVVSYPKGFLVLWLNDHYSIFWNVFFKYLTFLGDGAIIGLLALALLFVRYYWSAVVALMGIMQLIVVQGLKNFIFGPTPRPAAFFENYEPPLKFVEGVSIHHLFSIPSGHATTAFSVAFIFILLLNTGKLTTIFLFILALITATSRIYLAQHFLMDVLLGALIGTLMARIAYRFGEYLRKRNPDASFFQKSLRDLV